MDYDEILNQLGQFGTFQWILCILLGITTALNAETTYMFNFLLGNHLHRCLRPDVEEDRYLLSNVSTTYNATQCILLHDNGTSTGCNKWVYDQSVYKSTLISKFDMVCEQKFTRSHIVSSFFFGQLIGSALYGFLSDIFGRRLYLIGSCVFLFLSNIATPWMPNTFLVMVCQVFNAAATIANYNICIILVTEFVNPANRVLANFMINFSFVIGEFVLLLEAFFLRKVEYLMIAIASPILLCLTMFIFIPETPRWLITKGRTGEARKVLEKIATYNKINININESVLCVKETKTYSFRKTITLVFHSKILLIRLLILIAFWFTINMIYFGIALNIGDLGGDVYVNFAIAATTEAAAILLCLCFHKASRRCVLFLSSLIGSISCLSTFFTSFFGGVELEWATVTLAMIGRFGITVAFFILYIVTVEIFPTTMRATVGSVCSTFGKMGGLVSPYIGKLGVFIDTRFGIALPLIIFGIVGIITSFTDLFLPETKSADLPDTIEDIIQNERERDNSKTAD